MGYKVNKTPLCWGIRMNDNHQRHRVHGGCALGLWAAVLLSGCAMTKETPQPVPIAADAVLLGKIDQYANSASAALQKLAEVERSSRPAVNTTPFTVPPGMEVITNVSWNGPIETLVSRMAMVSGYTVMAPSGRRPPTPVLVSINVQGASVADVLRDIGAQAGTTANIIVRPTAKTIEIQYNFGAGSCSRSDSNC